MEQHIATYSIDSQSLTHTITLLYEIQQRTGIAPTTILVGANLFEWNQVLAHKLATGKILEQEYTAACNIKS